ncbi:hypothetical protein SAMN05216603_110136 [Pseudomonas benzenivorans]|nr:hypothetical protein SAMN05216603_110136 [Pseudomonas benzenivorans]
MVDNLNIQTTGPRGPALLQDIWLEKLAYFDREVIQSGACTPRVPDELLGHHVVISSQNGGGAS